MQSSKRALLKSLPSIPLIIIFKTETGTFVRKNPLRYNLGKDKLLKIEAAVTRQKFILSALTLMLTGFSASILAEESAISSEAEAVELETLIVTDQTPEASLNNSSLDTDSLAIGQARSSDTASLFKDVPGVELNTGGGVSSLPSIHGMADDRVKISVNGMNITSACSNHMNPSLSYISPANVGKAQVMAGITPVSMGGDSTGGTLVVESLAPDFASSADKPLFFASAGGFFRSANDNFGNNASLKYANQDYSFDSNASWSKAINYRTGDDGPAVLPSKFLTSNLYLRGAKALENGYVAADVSLQHIPYQGFPNQRMDVVENNAVLGGISFENQYDWGKLDGRVYHHQTWHTMDTLDERNTSPMLMKTDGSDLGYRIRAHIPFQDIHILRVGSEFFRQTLDDWWPSTQYTGPQDFLSINHGERNRLGTFVEWQADWNSEWTSQLGLRNDMVWMDTDPVHGYYSQAVDPKAAIWESDFNQADRSKTDTNFDVTGQTRYTANAWSQYELGIARKTRSPNLYERYSWYGHNSMITWFGDGNAYAGNLDLKPEVAYNFSLTGSWHDVDEKAWSMRVSPYYTHIVDYIWGQTESVGMDGFRGMQFINLPYADLYGIDAAMRYVFLPESDAGKFAARGKLAYVRGIGKNGLSGRTCPYGNAVACQVQGWPEDGLQAPDKVNLYHMMPLNGSITLEHGLEGDWGSWQNELSLDMITSKTTVAKTYGEPVTPGYVLLNILSRYQYENIKLDLGVDNLLDKRYYHPLGGVDIVGTYSQGFPPPGLLPVAAMGRSVFVSVNVDY